MTLQSPGYRLTGLHVIDVGHDWPDDSDGRRNADARITAILEIMRGVPSVVAASASLSNQLGFAQM